MLQITYKNYYKTERELKINQEKLRNSLEEDQNEQGKIKKLIVKLLNQSKEKRI